jgi:hypothetical protein
VADGIQHQAHLLSTDKKDILGSCSIRNGRRHHLDIIRVHQKKSRLGNDKNASKQASVSTQITRPGVVWRWKYVASHLPAGSRRDDPDQQPSRSETDRAKQIAFACNQLPERNYPSVRQIDDKDGRDRG